MGTPNIHILVDEEVKDFLEKNKIHPREPFNDVVRRLLKIKDKGDKKQ